jgi:hypothetical protein
MTTRTQPVTTRHPSFGALHAFSMLNGLVLLGVLLQGVWGGGILGRAGGVDWASCTSSPAPSPYSARWRPRSWQSPPCGGTVTLTGTRPWARCLTPAWRSGPGCHTARARRCPRACWPGWPLAWPTCTLRARPTRAAPRRGRWRSAWTRSPRCCWTGCRPACRAGGGDLQDRGGRQPGPVAWSLGPLGSLGCCQPDGTFITSLDQLRRWLGEMARSSEAVCLDGLGTRVQRPRGWANQKVP